MNKRKLQKNEFKPALEISLSKDQNNKSKLYLKKIECSKEGARRCLLSLILKRIFQFSQIHKSTNIPNASFFLLFFYFHFSSFFHFCKMSYIDSMYWHFYLISLHFKCQISVILFFLICVSLFTEFVFVRKVV